MKHSPITDAEPHKRSFVIRTLTSPIAFATLTATICALWVWPRRWLIAGAPVLQLMILLGESKGYRILPGIHLWPIFTTLHLVYAICSTSWLLYWAFAAACYPSIFLVALFQFKSVGDFVKRRLRSVLRMVHFIDDKIAFFDLPALEIDTEVDGLMVLRGVTFSLSNLSFIVHGVEVGIKLSDDMELAIQTEEVKVKLFRGIEVADCYANLKGGEYEMTFGGLDEKTVDADGDAVFVEGTALLEAASKNADVRSLASMEEEKGACKMTEVMTNGSAPEPTSPKEGLDNVTTLSPDKDEAFGLYQKILTFILETNSIHEATEHVQQVHSRMSDGDKSFNGKDLNALRAAVASHLHSHPSVPHPPQKSIKVTTLQNLSSATTKAFMHRLPLLLRMLLNPLAYFHPVKIRSVTATASGRWIDHMLVENVFKDYAESDSELRKIKKRISAWLSDANFVVELADFNGVAQVPFLPTYDITCNLSFQDVMAYRSVPAEIGLNQVVRLGGADANFIIPSFLLPHHEHLLPPVPTKEDKTNLKQDVEEANGKPKEIQAQYQLEQAIKDETNVKISVHARLPAVFDQELLDFIAAMVKVSKIVEMEKALEDTDDPLLEGDDEDNADAISLDGASISSTSSKAKIKAAFSVKDRVDDIKMIKHRVKSGLKRSVVGGLANDRWIAKMVGKITRKLETAKGEAGYSGDIPIPLEPYRATGWLETEGEKLLP